MSTPIEALERLIWSAVCGSSAGVYYDALQNLGAHAGYTKAQARKVIDRLAERGRVTCSPEYPHTLVQRVKP